MVLNDDPKLTVHPRWREIVIQIESAIESGELKPGTALPSETQLALDHAVCRMTAHRAMTDLQTRGLVIRKRRTGTVVATPARVRTGNVAVLCFAISDFPTAAYLAGLREGLSQKLGLLLCDTGEDGAREADFLCRMRDGADAIVCLPSAAPENNALLEEIIASQIPLLCLDRMPAGLNVDAIVSDNYASTLEAMRRLTARGHRRIAHLTDLRPSVSSTQERLRGYHDALREIGETEPSRWTRFFTTFSVARDLYYPQLVREVHDAILALMHSPEPPTALFCLQDAYMAGALEACARLGIAVPDELEIMAFNDCPPQFLPLPAPVLRIVQQPHQMGVMAGKRLTSTLQGAHLQDADARVQITHVPATIHDPLATT